MKKFWKCFSQWQKAFQVAKTEYIWIAEADDSSDARFWKQL